MTEQYLRKVRLIVGGTNAPGVALDPDAGIDLSELHIQFQVKNTTAQVPKRAQIRIYNLNQDTARKIQNEFTRVELSAGYGDDIGLIFKGEICYIRNGRESATDTFVEIFAQDSDAAYNFASTNRSLAKGWTPDQLHDALLQDLSPYGVTAGYKPTFTDSAASRGLACYGMTRDLLRDLADQQGCEWSIEDGRLNFVKLSSFIPGEAVVLTAATGMIGTPEQTIQGLVVRCLLNSRIKSGGQVKIDNASISTLTIRTPYTGAEFVPSADADGSYTSRVVQHVGDTRGQEWYTMMICVAVDGTAPASGPTLLDVPNG